MFLPDVRLMDVFTIFNAVERILEFDNYDDNILDDSSGNEELQEMEKSILTLTRHRGTHRSSTQSSTTTTSTLQ